MKRRIMLTFFVLLSGMLIGVVFSSRVQTAQRASRPLNLPKAWIPFSADMAVTFQDGSLQRGRYYRSSDGSQRWNIRELKTAGRDQAEILNEAANAYYASVGQNRWTRHPLRIHQTRPIGLLDTTKGLTSYPYRLDLQIGGTGSLSASSGFSAYLVTMSTGNVRLMVPELNLFPVVQQVLGHYVKVYSNIVTGDISSDVFDPPVGAEVTYSPVPMPPPQSSSAAAGSTSR
jgi:hypothetical protein